MANNYYPAELLPNFRRTPPPEVLRAQARQMWNSWFPQTDIQGTYQPVQYQTLHGTIQTPPPEVLRAQAQQTLNNFANEYALPLAGYLGTQALENAAIYGTTGKTLGQHLTGAVSKGLNSPQGLAAISALQATRTGAPIVNGITKFANSPAGKKAGSLFEKVIDWGL